MSRAAWFPVPLAFIAHPAWTRQPDRDLYILLLRDAQAAGTPTVRFSLAAYMKRLECVEGNEPRRYGRWAIRGALERLRRDGLVRVATAAARRSLARRCHWFPVEIIDWIPNGFRPEAPHEPPHKVSHKPRRRAPHKPKQAEKPDGRRAPAPARPEHRTSLDAEHRTRHRTSPRTPSLERLSLSPTGTEREAADAARASRRAAAPPDPELAAKRERARHDLNALLMVYDPEERALAGRYFDADPDGYLEAVEETREHLERSNAKRGPSPAIFWETLARRIQLDGQDGDQGGP
ncbi:MAG: hypothetical protein ACYTEZ_00195 [Planctomycetota bacterium]|jgi:hypothetical protein